MPGLAQWAPTPMSQRPGPAWVNACVGMRRGGTQGFHTHAQPQQACHRPNHRRQRAAHRRHRQRQRSRRARTKEVRPHRTPLHRGLVRGVACGDGGMARRGGRRHNRHPAPLPRGPVAAGPGARAVLSRSMGGGVAPRTPGGGGARGLDDSRHGRDVLGGSRSRRTPLLWALVPGALACAQAAVDAADTADTAKTAAAVVVAVHWRPALLPLPVRRHMPAGVRPPLSPAPCPQ